MSSTSTTNYDTMTLEQLTGVVGKKWTSYPEAIGAFIAEMDFGTAPCVIDVLRDTVDHGFFGYLPDAMEEGLAKAVSGWYRDVTGWDVPQERIHSLPDVLKGLEVTLNYYAPKGGKVIVPTPGYMPFLFVPKFSNREIIEVPMLREGDSWQFDYDGIDQAFADGGEVLIVCNPHNPIGRVLTRDEMVRLSEIVEKHGGRVFSDEIHAPLVYDGYQHIPYASVSETTANHTITAIAGSKAWNLAGLKCAQIVLSNEADQEIWKNGASWAGHGASTIGVIASIAAFNEGRDWLNDVISYLDGNRKRLAELVAEELPGVQYSMPQGTYLGWLDFSDTKVPVDVATFFRDHAGVAITDGGACGEVGCKCVRFNFAMPRPLMEQAVRQMGKALQAL
ncbi:MAG TPA: aminotransferase class I/II-fold pyridoxal phosphate-dependent enzyme [Thermomicrobiales bacterium]|nr:aminotransferase class I/II-fold pyridoxal phosphate-dependent enzyme [Thermomicrobiales bacterium]